MINMIMGIGYWVFWMSEVARVLDFVMSMGACFEDVFVSIKMVTWTGLH